MSFDIFPLLKVIFDIHTGIIPQSEQLDHL